MEKYRDKYPDWFDENGTYIAGSLENRIERIKEALRDNQNTVLYGMVNVHNSDELRAELVFLTTEGTTKIDNAKTSKIAEIDAYDKSRDVEWFIVDGVGMWYDAPKRVTIRNLVESSIKEGRDTITLWTEEEPIIPIEVPCEMALALLAKLEVYAGDCLANTQKHKAAVNALTSVEEIEVYDYKTGYPDKLNLSTK